jgi:hypothetical protein
MIPPDLRIQLSNVLMHEGVRFWYSVVFFPGIYAEKIGRGNRKIYLFLAILSIRP